MREYEIKLNNKIRLDNLSKEEDTRNKKLIEALKALEGIKRTLLEVVKA